MAKGILKTYGAITGVQEWIPLNRHDDGVITITLDIDGVTSIDIEGTIAKVNRETLSANDAFKVSGAISITNNFQFSIDNFPLEAIRLNVIGEAPQSIKVRILQ